VAVPEAPVEQDVELQEWLDSLEFVLEHQGPERTAYLLSRLQERAARSGAAPAEPLNTPYLNTIPASAQPKYPGNLALERRIKSLVRWNAMAMVVRANREEEGIGGHISTYASSATLLEVAFQHFFHAPSEDHPGDQVFFQGHASPGIYARAFLEGRLSEADVGKFRRELAEGGGLSSYPHPWLMPGFWQFPTVSMGLGPIMAIYQARMNRYLEDRSLARTSRSHVWAFLGDGETDEPESLGALSLASREQLDNLIFVVNCNLQRLDGPVRGNGQIIQELEAVFRGAGWNVIKVILGSDWDPLLERDEEGLIAKRWRETVDGQVQRYATGSGEYIRKHFWGAHPDLAALVANYSDEQLARLRLGGHDPVKVYAAYHAAIQHRGAPTVILARTIKGYGLGEAGEGRNVSHQQKKLNENELREFRARFGIPISDEEMIRTPLYRPPEESPEIRYLLERRQVLGGAIPARVDRAPRLAIPGDEVFGEFLGGSGGRSVSTTMVMVRILGKLMRHDDIGRYVVPIVPDEARTFGMETLFRQSGIYSHVGQLYEPVDRESLLYYREAKNGQILEEGITEAGSISSFIAAGTAYATWGVPTIPIFLFYSMFGLQRVGDLVWAAGDMRCRGFLVGATSGRTTLAGEGLQHQDGNSHVLALPVPNLLAYDPAYAFEIAVLVRRGLQRMYADGDSVFYYLTVHNEPYEMPPMPEGAEEGIVRGMYCLQRSGLTDARASVQLLGSGAILNEVVAAARWLEDNAQIAADVWSVTSFKELYRDAIAQERWNHLHRSEPARTSHVAACLSERGDVAIAATDYVRALPLSIARWSPKPFHALGTDGFGRSDSRTALRDFFEVDRRYVALAALVELSRIGRVDADLVERAAADLGIDPDKRHPLEVA